MSAKLSAPSNRSLSKDNRSLLHRADGAVQRSRRVHLTSLAFIAVPSFTIEGEREKNECGDGR